MLDFSRDVSNANEFVIAVKQFDEQNSKVLEQNQTKSNILFDSLTSLLANKENRNKKYNVNHYR